MFSTSFSRSSSRFAGLSIVTTVPVRYWQKDNMDFGSKYVYNYSDSEEESVSDEEFETGLDTE